MILRNYQEVSVEKCLASLNKGENALLQAPTGAGKSVILAEITKRLCQQVPSFRCLLLIDRETLVKQLTKTFTDFGLDVGIACASVQKKVVLNKQITIASRQTLANHLGSMAPVHLLIADEAHLLPLMPSSNQYSKIITKMLEYNKRMRLLGCTASPWRLDAGFIYGNRHRADLTPFWGDLTHKITFKELTESGHICKLKGLLADHEEPDLSNVNIIGDYNLGELSTVMCKYVQTVKEVIEEHLEGHTHILVFGCTIEHCEELKKVIPNSEVLHSKTKNPEEVLARFDRGEFRTLISVNKLSIGFDFPKATALVLARPTMSSSLLLQIIGRILRTLDGKEYAVLIDLTNNVKTHCPTLDLDKIKVVIPNPPGGGVAPVKFCMAENGDGLLCYAENHPSASFCIECGENFPRKTIPAEFMPELSKVNFEAEQPTWYDVTGMSLQEHTSAKSKKKLLRVVLEAGGFMSKKASMWICCASDYSAGAVKRGKIIWNMFTKDEFPDDRETALWIAQESFNMPSKMLCETTDRGFLNVIELDFTDNDPFKDDAKTEEVPF